MKKKDFEDDEDLSFIDINEDDYSDYNLAEEEYEGEEEYNEEYGEDDEEEDSGKGKIFHIAFLLASIAIVSAIVVILIKWNKGEIVTVNPEDLTQNYDIESMDFYVPFDPTTVEGYVDDGELNIVILCDDSMGHCQDETSIPALIAKKTGANVTTCYLEGGRMTTNSVEYDTEAPFSLYYQVNQLTSGSDGSYDFMLEAVQNMPDPGKYYEYWDMLHKVPFKKADIIIIQYGMNDFFAKAPILGTEATLTQPYGLADGITCVITSNIEKIKARFPYTQLIISSPNFMFATNDKGEFIGADMVNYGEGTYGEYMSVLAHYSCEFSATYVDNYFLDGFNPGDYEDCLEDNMIYPNEKGREMIADHLIKYFYYNK